MFRLVTRLLELLTLLSLLFNWGFSIYLENDRPSHAMGNLTVQVVNHGTSYFVTRTEHLISVLIWPLCFVLVVIAGGFEAAGRLER